MAPPGRQSGQAVHGGGFTCMHNNTSRQQAHIHHRRGFSQHGCNCSATRSPTCDSPLFAGRRRPSLPSLLLPAGMYGTRELVNQYSAQLVASVLSFVGADLRVGTFHKFLMEEWDTRALAVYMDGETRDTRARQLRYVHTWLSLPWPLLPPFMLQVDEAFFAGCLSLVVKTDTQQRACRSCKLQPGHVAEMTPLPLCPPLPSLQPCARSPRRRVCPAATSRPTMCLRVGARATHPSWTSVRPCGCPTR